MILEVFAVDSAWFNAKPRMIQYTRGLRASSESRELIIALGNGVGGSVVSKLTGDLLRFQRRGRRGL
jgi:hypothetical protein